MTEKTITKTTPGSAWTDFMEDYSKACWEFQKTAWKLLGSMKNTSIHGRIPQLLEDMGIDVEYESLNKDDIGQPLGSGYTQAAAKYMGYKERQTLTIDPNTSPGCQNYARAWGCAARYLDRTKDCTWWELREFPVCYPGPGELARQAMANALCMPVDKFLDKSRWILDRQIEAERLPVIPGLAVNTLSEMFILDIPRTAQAISQARACLAHALLNAEAGDELERRLEPGTVLTLEQFLP